MSQKDIPGAGEPKPNCEGIEQRLLLFACDELGPEERAAVEVHVGSCARCAAELARELRFQQGLAATSQAPEFDPSGLLLSRCRSELDEALDDAEAPLARRGWLAGFRSANWLLTAFVRHPAWSAALLLMLGAGVGALTLQSYQSRVSARQAPALVVSGERRLSDRDLQTMGIAGINWTPDGSSGSPSVELRLTAEKPMELKGNLDDTNIRRVLTFVVLNGQRFDPGVRLDSVDMLRTRLNDADVRHALCAAARKDPNPGVRLRALEALRGGEQDDLVQQAVLDALENDSNPGVRVEAVNLLVGTLRAMEDKGFEDQRIVNILRQRMRKDPNNYIRMQSAAAIRQLGPRETY